MKRLLTLSTFLLLSIMTFAKTEVNGIYYEFSGTEATVVSGANKYTGSVTIPASVTTGGNTYSVTSIGSSAFYGCSGLTSVTIPNSVTSIGDQAFSGSSNLTSVIIPNSVISIGYYAFAATAWFNNQPDGLVYAGKVVYKYKGTMPANMSISIKEGTLGIAESAFQNCSNLTSVTIPSSVIIVGDYAFSWCSGLTSVEIPNGVKRIGESAFSKCSITSITIPNSVTSIGEIAFSDCSKLTSITIPNSVTSIERGVFLYCTGLTSVTIPNSVTSIGDDAFCYCSGLTSVTIPNSVTSIGDDAFRYCSGLTSVTIPNSMTSIGDDAFDGCLALTTIYSYIETPTIETGFDFDSSNYTNATLFVLKGTKEKYLVTSGWKNFNNIEEFTYELGTTNLNPKGYATLSYASDVEVEGADVYTAVKNGNKISCTKVEQVVPAYNGVILKGEPNAEVTLNYIYTEQDELAGNELKATTTATGTAASETALVLSGKTFVNYTGGDFVADKAYMPYDGNSANAIEMVFDGVTAIDGIALENNLLDKTVIKTIEDGKLVIKTANGKYSSVGAKMK